MRQELTGDQPRASQGLDVMEMDPLEQGHDNLINCIVRGDVDAGQENKTGY